MPMVNIFVELDTSGNPAVILTVTGGASGRAVQAGDGDTIKWLKKDNDDDFDIMDLEPSGENEAFGPYSIGGSGQWLQCEYTPTNLNPFAAFAYTLQVETPDGTEYDTTQRADRPTDDRPVIRN